MDKLITQDHHIIPKHMGGGNEKENLVNLTLSEHADVHLERWELYGNWQDWCAWKGLSRSIPFAEATKLAQSMANKTKTESQLEACNKNRMLALKSWTGQKHKEETKKRMSKSNKKYWGELKDRPWQKKTYIIEGKTYTGLDEVMNTFGCSMPTVYNRIKNPRFDWHHGKFKHV